MKSIKFFFKSKVFPVFANLFSERTYWQSKINYGLARAAATAPLRSISDKEPQSWEFSGFSQNGEDGIIDYLVSKLKLKNKYFIEIGASNGLENNTAWLAFAKNFKGLMIEGDPDEYKIAIKIAPWYVTCINSFVTLESLHSIEKKLLFQDPDLLSVDIDGMDYHIVSALLKNGVRPKILVVEYNSSFGPEKSITIPYKSDFRINYEHPSKLYYGVSISAWKKVLHAYDYSFITVDSNGVNAFFVNNQYFDAEFLDNLHKVNFEENAHQLRKFKKTHEEQFKIISNLTFINV